MSALTLPGLVAAQVGSAIAAIDGDRVVTFGELDSLNQRLAGGLRRAGISHGDRVAVWLPNSLQWMVTTLALSRLGAVTVSVNTRFRSVEVQDIVGRAGCKALVLWPGFKGIDFKGILAGTDPATMARLETIITVGGDDETLIDGLEHFAYGDLGDHDPYSDLNADGETPSHIFTTSGTTSAPKFVLHKQATLVRHGHDVVRAFGYDKPAAKVLQATPFCGVYGFSQAMGALAAGIPNIIMRLFTAADAVQLISDHQITQFNVGDDMLATMLAASADDADFASLEFMGVAIFNPGLEGIAAEAEKRGIRAYGLYGMSEVFALFSKQPDDLPVGERRLGGGHPVCVEASVRVRDSETGDLLNDGSDGEIEIFTPNMLVEYADNPDATAAAFTDDGYFRTGDVGHLRADGSFVFIARAGDVMRIAGFLVSPAEIEDHILRLDGIDACQAVDAADEDAKPRVIAFVRGNHIPDEATVIAHCKAGLANFKVPTRVIAVPDFPMADGANGKKVQKAVLREWAALAVQGRDIEIPGR